jgi:hypothetical protein
MTLEPNYNIECEHCDTTPTVVLYNEDEAPHYTRTCGACYFNTMDMQEPSDWND